MQEMGINGTFKKIIYESSEMVFLADDIYPYTIFYANESFEEQLGNSLTERNLVGLGLDINAYIFKEELIIAHFGKDFSFRLELPNETGSDYFLFYQGKEVLDAGVPTGKEVQQFFKSDLDLMAIGEHDYLTYLNDAATLMLGYVPEELLNKQVCPLIHRDDLGKLEEIWRLKGQGRDQVVEVRFKHKKGGYKNLECTVRFSDNRFYIIARDTTVQARAAERSKRLTAMKLDVPGLTQAGTWSYDVARRRLVLDAYAQQLVKTDSSVLNFDGATRERELQLIASLSKDIERTLMNGEVSGFSTKLSDSRGKKVELRWQAEAEEDGVIGVVWDETPRLELQSKRKLYQESLLDNPEAMIIVRSNGEIVLTSKEASKLFKMAGLKKWMHLDDLNSVFETPGQWISWVNTVDGQKSTQVFSCVQNSAETGKLSLEVSAKLSLIDGDKYIVVSFRNVSGKISLEQTLEKNTDYLMNLTEQVPGGLYQMVLDSEGKISFSFLSKGISTVLGLEPGQLDEFSDISVAISRVHPMDLPQVIMSSVASAHKLEPWQCQFRVRTNLESTDYQWVLGSARPQRMENGDMVWYGYLTDISKQKEFESKLDEARLIAEKASQIKSEFLSMISHELRTPLNAISGSVYSLLQEQPSEHQKTALNTINFAVDNLIIMINDLLDFQKIEAGKLTIEKVPFQLGELMNQVVNGLLFHARDSKNQLALQLSDGLDIWLKGDKTRLSQILNNLITNALKFTSSGNVDVKAELMELGRGKARVYFEVKDTGIGIAKENQEKIFNDFDQVRPTFSTKYGGTGLGLSITRKLLDLMGSKIGLESAEGIGSTFYFEVLFDTTEDQRISAVRNGHAAEDAQSHLKLLMAEDNDVNALVLGKIIKKWGFTYDRVTNGQEALDAVADGDYDCVLMDIQMPVMDGFEATVAIKKFAEIPVIALTAAAKLEIMERIEETGFDGFVAKPIDAAELLKKIKDVTS